MSEDRKDDETPPKPARVDSVAPSEGKPASVRPPAGDGDGDEPPPSSSYVGPGISSIRPRHVGMDGGMLVAVFGGGFVEGCHVRVDGARVEVEFIDAFCVRFEAPAHPLGDAMVEVENPDAQRSQKPVVLEYARGPAISDVAPHDVPPEGGLEIIVSGSGFLEGCAISLFGVHAPKATVESESTLRFTAPPQGSGPVQGTLVITNPDGLATRFEDALFYRALEPRLDRVEPNHGWITGGKAISVHGKDFHPSCAAKIGEIQAEVRWKDAEHVELVVPVAEKPGKVTITLQNPDGTTAELADSFSYEPIPAPPKIISLLPDKGILQGNAVIRLAGDNFSENTRVKIGEVSAVTRFVSTKLVDFELPARTMPGKVAVEVSDSGITVRSEDAFTYYSLSAPKIIGLEPMSGPTTGGTAVVIDGDGFPKNATVRFGKELAKAVVKSSTRIEAVTPASKNAGMADVEVSSAESGPGVMKNGFRYDLSQPPTIISVAPTKGGTNGGTELTIEGKNFAIGVTVTIGKKPPKFLKRISGQLLEVKTPEGDDGAMVDVVVKNPDGKEATQKRAFQYDARYRG